MNTETLTSPFQTQRDDFCLMVNAETLKKANALPVKLLSSSLALGFAESLILCPSNSAILSLIRNDLTGAKAFVLAVNCITRKIGNGSLQIENETRPGQTRFFLLAATVQDYLEANKRQNPDLWQ